MKYASLRSRLDPILPTVEKPGRYVGLERNVIRKDLGSGARSRSRSRFPDTYEIGMSHTGLKILYELVNRRPTSRASASTPRGPTSRRRCASAASRCSRRRAFAPGGGLRRARLFAPGRGQLLEHPEHARPRGDPRVAARPPGVGPDRPRRRALHGESRADRGLLRRVPRSATQRRPSPSSSTRTAKRGRRACRGATSSRGCRRSRASTFRASTTSRTARTDGSPRSPATTSARPSGRSARGCPC